MQCGTGAEMVIWQTIAEALRRQGQCALVTQVSVEGSAPREAGARMIVMPDGTFTGTIGGGALEWHALARAQSALGDRRNWAGLSKHALGPELGQCCGGVSRLLIEVFTLDRVDEVGALAAAELAGQFSTDGEITDRGVIRKPATTGTTDRDLVWDGDKGLRETFGDVRRRVFLFGAGHIGRALILALAPLPFKVTWIDSRKDAFPAVAPANVELVSSADPARELVAAPDGCFVLVITHIHALDQDIVQAALTADRFNYVGVIGSRTKRARFASRMRKAGVSEQLIDSLVCPIGVPGITSKQPAIIAAGIAAQLLECDELVKSSQKPMHSAAEQVKLVGGKLAKGRG